MREHTFIGNFDFSQKEFSLIDPDLIHQVSRVLRLENGDTILLNNGERMVARAKIKEITKSHIDVTVEEVFPNTREPEREVTLYAGVIKKDKFEWLVEKAVEGGVSRIVPVMGERSLKLTLNMERLGKIAREAAEQSGRGIVPKIGETLSFSAALKDSGKNDLTFIFDVNGGMKVGELLTLQQKAHTLGLFVGPEGGWTENELKEAKDAGAKSVSLGALTLRAETAGAITAFLAAMEA